MKKHWIVAALLAASTMGGVALADQPGKNWLTQEQTTQKLQAQGLSHVTALEADDGHWEGEAVKDGKIVEFHADPLTGKIMSVKPKD